MTKDQGNQADNSDVSIVLAPSRRTTPKITADQKIFAHNYSLSLERLAESLFGQKYHKATDRTDVGFWKEFYLSALAVIQSSLFKSIGSIDRQHSISISDQLERTITSVKRAKAKDEIHASLIVGLFKLVFLLMGRLPYAARGKQRSFSTFRTLTYSQTEEQLSWLLQSYVEGRPQEHGFGDHFDAHYAYFVWAREHKHSSSDRSAYVDWVRTTVPQTYSQFR
ncbi:MAG: hypothetical protein RLO80_05065 [Hyphomonas sp.]